MFSLTCLHLSLSTSDAKAWSLSFSVLFTVKSFFFAKQAHILKRVKKPQSIQGVYEAAMASQTKNKTTQPLIGG